MRPSTFPPAGKVVPEYKGMLALAQKYAGQPFELVLFPCNQVLPHHQPRGMTSHTHTHTLTLTLTMTLESFLLHQPSRFRRAQRSVQEKACGAAYL